jgi:hypothetical protein
LRSHHTATIMPGLRRRISILIVAASPPRLSRHSRQCLSRRIAQADTLKRRIKSWQQERNRATAKIRWQFTSQDARIKLRSLYPSLEP